MATEMNSGATSKEIPYKDFLFVEINIVTMEHKIRSIKAPSQESFLRFLAITNVKKPRYMAYISYRCMFSNLVVETLDLN